MKKTDLVDSIFLNFNPNELSTEAVDKKPITQWLPVEYKQKYDELQSKTKSRFGKKIQEMIMKAIDLVDEKAS